MYIYVSRHMELHNWIRYMKFHILELQENNKIIWLIITELYAHNFNYKTAYIIIFLCSSKIMKFQIISHL